MPYYRVVRGKHHTGWQRKVTELTLPEIKKALTENGISFKEAPKEKLAELLAEKVGELIDTRRTYVEGEVFYTDQDLTRLNDLGNPNNLKFQQVNEQGQALPGSLTPPFVPNRYQSNPHQAKPTQEQANLEFLKGRTERQLRELAEAEEIDLGSAKTKEQIIEVLSKNPVT